MPKLVNEEKRRERIAEAVWNIAADQGLERATIRAVAAECGLSVGSIQHSFRTQEELKRFAMELVVQRVTTRLNDAEGLPFCAGDKAATIAELLMETRKRRAFGPPFRQLRSRTKVSAAIADR